MNVSVLLRIARVALCVVSTIAPGSMVAANCPNATLRVSADVPIEMHGAVALDHDVLRLEGGAQAFREVIAGIPDHADLDALARRSNGLLLVSFDTTVTLGGIVFHPADVIEFNPTLVSYALAFDSRAASVPDGVDTDAVTLAANGTMSLSFDTPFGTSPLHYRPGDLIDVSAGQLSTKRLDASTAGLADGVNLDAAGFDGLGLLVVSLDSPGTVAGVTYLDEDLLSRSGTGVWQMYTRFAGLDAGWQVADLDALDIQGVGDGVFCNGYE